MLVFAGNPVLSSPGGNRLGEAMEQLDFCVAIDTHITETSRHADVILPSVSPLERDDLDIVMPAVSVRNHIRFSPAAVPKREGRQGGLGDHHRPDPPPRRRGRQGARWPRRWASARCSAWPAPRARSTPRSRPVPTACCARARSVG